MAVYGLCDFAVLTSIGFTLQTICSLFGNHGTRLKQRQRIQIELKLKNIPDSMNPHQLHST